MSPDQHNLLVSLGIIVLTLLCCGSPIAIGALSGTILASMIDGVVEEDRIQQQDE